MKVCKQADIEALPFYTFRHTRLTRWASYLSPFDLAYLIAGDHKLVQTCHTVYPRLTPFGEAFRRDGYRFPGVDSDYAKQEPVAKTRGDDAAGKMFGGYTCKARCQCAVGAHRQHDLPAPAIGADHQQAVGFEDGPGRTSKVHNRGAVGFHGCKITADTPTSDTKTR